MRLLSFPCLFLWIISWIRYSSSTFLRIDLKKWIPFFLQALSQQLCIFNDILKFFLSLNNNLLSHFVCVRTTWTKWATITTTCRWIHPIIFPSCEIFRRVKIWFFRSSLNLADRLRLLVFIPRVFLHLHEQLRSPVMLCVSLILG